MPVSSTIRLILVSDVFQSVTARSACESEVPSSARMTPSRTFRSLPLPSAPPPISFPTCSARRNSRLARSHYSRSRTTGSRIIRYRDSLLAAPVLLPFSLSRALVERKRTYRFRIVIASIDRNAIVRIADK